MRKLTKLQYQVIFLYSKGLTFKEIDKTLATASKGAYTQIRVKDKSRLTRAKLSRVINIRNYKEDLKKYLDTVKENNKHYKKYTQWLKEKYTIDIKVAKFSFRNQYIKDMLDKSFKSYNRYKLTFLKNHLEKVA
ncbi:MAG: hypothetical protein PHS78_08510 [Aliarcobacter skirrowii]|uniref:hypothetical protein n=1 Tax=Aliarcobacter skirrowii TaxID=28200 RepID=UPI002432FA4C|nr:hypothetical protein [Aliarcobacter skirrowii]MDD2509064.1 hypothetical protein [Aliarcobacter skirrowii]MDD3497046.1 hypothetical protein [Aliarcobacter skirrowii]